MSGLLTVKFPYFLHLSIHLSMVLLLAYFIFDQSTSLDKCCNAIANHPGSLSSNFKKSNFSFCNFQTLRHQQIHVTGLFISTVIFMDLSTSISKLAYGLGVCL